MTACTATLLFSHEWDGCTLPLLAGQQMQWAPCSAQLPAVPASVGRLCSPNEGTELPSPKSIWCNASWKLRQLGGWAQACTETTPHHDCSVPAP